MSNVHLLDLPVEVLHYIFDHLDTNTILQLLRLVCKRLHDVTITYRRFTLNFTSMTKNNIRCVAQFIRPDCIRAIIFSDTDEIRQKQIEFFLTIFDIRQSNGLKSLTFRPIIIQNQQTLFKLSEDAYKYILSSLRMNNFDYLTQHLLQPLEYTLQNLTIRICTYNQYRTILQTLHCLRTFVVDYCDTIVNNRTINSFSIYEKHQQLMSFVIRNCQLSVEHLQLFLLLTPSVVHLKLVSHRSMYDSVFDGSSWEQFIQIQLSQLKQFEFFFQCPVERDAPVHSVNSIITTFRTPFWISNKHWLVTCAYIPRLSQITICTDPMCLNDGELLISCKALPVNSVCRLSIHRTNEIDNFPIEETMTMLDLKGYFIGKRGIQDFADLLPNLKMLKTLNLPENLLGDEGIERLHYSLQNSTTITTLHLGNNEIGTIGTQYLAEILRTNTTLRTLHLPLNQIRNTGVQYLADGLRYNTTLTTLNLRFNQIGDSNAQHLGMLLENNTGLRTLDLGGNNLGAQGAQFLANALIKNTTLTTLDLSGNNLGAKAAQHLADALPHITSLTTLNLSHDMIWDKGVRCIADALPYNTSLKELDLSGNNIEESGGQYLADGLCKNTQLIKLKLSSNSITDETMQRIDDLVLKNAS